MGFAGHFGGGAVNGFADALVSAAAADVAAHGIIDVGVGGVGLLREQGHCGHDLSGLAVAALRNVFLHPCFLHGWLPSAESPSMVVTFFPATLEIGVMQERVASPLMCTVQAPQSAMPQPNFVPVMFSVSRSTQSRGMSGLTSTDWAVPFSVKLIAMRNLLEQVDILHQLRPRAEMSDMRVTGGLICQWPIAPSPNSK